MATRFFGTSTVGWVIFPDPWTIGGSPGPRSSTICSSGGGILLIHPGSPGRMGIPVPCKSLGPRAARLFMKLMASSVDNYIPPAVSGGGAGGA